MPTPLKYWRRQKSDTVPSLKVLQERCDYLEQQVGVVVNTTTGVAKPFAGTMDDIADGVTYVKTENNYNDAAVTKLASAINAGEAIAYAVALG
jgi:hypothetical protein